MTTREQIDSSNCQDTIANQHSWRIRFCRIWMPRAVHPGLVQGLVLLPAISLMALILWVIWTRTAHVPYWDEWETVLLVQRAHQGTLTLGDLWGLHANVHRIVLPRLLDLALINMTGWNRQVEMTADLGIAIATSCLLFSILRRTMETRWGLLILVVPASLLFFSISQFADWFAPFQVAFTTTVFGAVLCMYALTTDSLGWRRFGLALLGAIIASLSAFAGLVAWFAFLPILCSFKDGRKVLIWVGCTVEVWLVYLAGMERPSSVGQSLGGMLSYAIIYLGSPVGFPDAARVFLFGAASIVLCLGNGLAYLLLRGNPRRALPWLSLALFVVLCAATTSYGRGSVGPLQAMSSRYHIYSGLWWLSIIVISTLVGEHVVSRVRTREQSVPLALARRILAVDGCVLLLACGSLLLANVAGFQDALVWQDTQRQYENQIIQYATASDSCLLLYFPSPDLLRPRAAFLAAEHLAIFSSATSHTGSGSTLQAVQCGVYPIVSTADWPPRR